MKYAILLASLWLAVMWGILVDQGKWGAATVAGIMYCLAVWLLVKYF